MLKDYASNYGSGETYEKKQRNIDDSSIYSPTVGGVSNASPDCAIAVLGFHGRIKKNIHKYLEMSKVLSPQKTLTRPKKNG